MDTTTQEQKSCSLKRRLWNIYTNIDAKPQLENLVDERKNELKQVEMKEAQGKKIRGKNLGIRAQKVHFMFFPKARKMKECRSGYNFS